MKTAKLISLLLAIVLLQTTNLFAQNVNQAFWVHEDQVKPSMLKEYEAVSKDFIKACKEHDLKDADWATARIDGGTYLTIAPINSMADFDKNPMAPLAEKMGEENFRAIFSRFDKCYDTHRNYMVHLIDDMSYMPNGLTTNTEGEDYRKWHFFHVTPQNVANLRDKMKKVKSLYETKGAKQHFRIYRNGFGSTGDYYLVVISAKDAQSYTKTSEETDKLLGEEGEKLFDDLMQYVHKYESKTGRMRPDLAYNSSN
ncbi:hypothetical protein [Salegentibacter salarius]|uniref:Uncharacterized protein n=1 Tax=Salegentibacter salarius TaxID=435906 RepID=A0A2N0TZ96_9FLAO|nr:hypothetical protein [Salegentibacter salarius]OEY73247.1 hypothetical protein BHS39_10235 [Salegentibacter salarius]PKD20067.1 hypothetical protein APR40_10215 [Salegentibacter salarius]SLJ98299.1 hypothetical protein SAMN05660445_02086 [Salegentibacter salarius]